jgi:hypothetical protein
MLRLWAAVCPVHHITPRFVEEHFRPEDMMALCPNHHDEATKGAMLEAMIWSYFDFERRH